MNADEFCRCAVRSALVRLNISFGISIGGKLVYTFRDNTSPMPRQMSVRSVVKLICSTVALWITSRARWRRLVTRSLTP